MKSKTVLAVVAVIAIVLVASTYFLLTPSEAPSQELIVRRRSDGTSLDPATFSLITDYAVISNIYNALVRYKPGTTEIEGDLAERWEVSDGGKVWTFYLRRGVKWHKGFGEFTAADVKYSYERIMDPNTGSIWKREFDLIESIDVIDNYTVRFTLKYPYAAFIHKVSNFRQGFIVNKRAVEQYGEDYRRNPVGTGPFVFANWTETELVLVANEEYFEGKPKLEKITFIPMTDESVATMALEAGEIHLMPVATPEAYKELVSKNNTDIVIYSKPSLSIIAIAFNTRMEPFNNKKVRQALYYATNKTAIVELQEGLGVEAKSFLAPGYFGHTTDLETYPYDVEKAKQLLAEAGYPNGFETTAYLPSGPIVQTFTLLKSMWEKVGVNLEIKQMESGAWFESIRRGEPPVSWIPLSARPPDPDIPLSMMFHTMSFPPGLNYMYYDQIDDLLEQARVETDVEARRAIYEEIQRKIADDVPCIPLYHGVQAYAMRSNVKGFVMNWQADFGPLYSVYLE